MGLLTVLIGSCVPTFDEDPALVEAPRLLAVRASPAEALPGERVTLAALYADVDGTVTQAPLAWSRCAARRPLAEPGPVSRACLTGQADAVAAIGEGLAVEVDVPDDVCRTFGPDPPPAPPGQPAGRPVDPDGTGGYYQPILVAPPDAARALFMLRVRCGVVGASQAQAAELRRRYRANEAPEPMVLRGAEAIDLDAPLVVDAGAEVDLRVRWPACPEAPVCGDGMCTLDEDVAACPEDCTSPRGCGGAETYLRFDPAALRLTGQREALRVAWYATAGRFAAASTGRAPDDPATRSDNTWTAPSEAGAASLWIVVRDDRGGTGWRTISVEVRAASRR